jgi:hypothetical protein
MRGRPLGSTLVEIGREDLETALAQLIRSEAIAGIDFSSACQA